MKLISALAAAALIAAPVNAQSNLRTVQCTDQSLIDQSVGTVSYTFDRKGRTYDYDRVTQSWVVAPANYEDFGDRIEERSAIVGNVYRHQLTSVSISDPMEVFESFTEIDLKKMTITTEVDAPGTDFDSVERGTCKLVETKA